MPGINLTTSLTLEHNSTTPVVEATTISVTTTPEHNSTTQPVEVTKLQLAANQESIQKLQKRNRFN